jgi:hypothetical protein
MLVEMHCEGYKARCQDSPDRSSSIHQQHALHDDAAEAAGADARGGTQPAPKSVRSNSSQRPKSGYSAGDHQESADRMSGLGACLLTYPAVLAGPSHAPHGATASIVEDQVIESAHGYVRRRMIFLLDRRHPRTLCLSLSYFFNSIAFSFGPQLDDLLITRFHPLSYAIFRYLDSSAGANVSGFMPAETIDSHSPLSMSS